MRFWVPVAPFISWVAHSLWFSSCSLNDFLVFLPLNPVWTQQGFWRFSQIGLNAGNPGPVTSSLGVKGLYQRISLQEGWCPGHLFWGRVCVRVHFFFLFLKKCRWNVDSRWWARGSIEGDYGGEGIKALHPTWDSPGPTLEYNNTLLQALRKEWNEFSSVPNAKCWL